MLMSIFSFITLNSYFSKYKKTSKIERTEIELKENEVFLENINFDHENSCQKNFKRNFLMLLAFITSFFMYGLLPGIVFYSTLPYSHKTLNLSINLGGKIISFYNFYNFQKLVKSTYNYLKGNLILPISIFYTMCSSSISYFRLIFEFLAGLSFTVYIILVSMLSPCPPLLEHWIGQCLIIFSWLIVEFVFMRTRCLVASKLEKISKENTFLLFGVVTLLGHALGGVFVCIWVDVFRFLKSRPDCILDYSYCKSA